MNTVWKVLRFELRYHLRRPATWLFAALMLAQGAWSGSQIARDNPAHQLLVNAAANVYYALASLGVGLAVVSVLLAGQALTRDVDYRTAPYLYSLPVVPQDFFVGRFLGTYLVVLALATVELAGLAAVPLLVPGQAGPVPLLALIQGFLGITIWQLFTLVSCAFSLTIFLRGIRGAYLTLVVVVLYTLIAETPRSFGAASNDLLLLLDLFGVRMLRDALAALSPADQQVASLPMPDMLLINRLVYLALPLTLLQQAMERFSFDWFQIITRPRTTIELADPPSVESIKPASKPHPLSARPDQPNLGSWIQRINRLTRKEFVDLTRQPIIRVFAGLLSLLALVFATLLNQSTDFVSLPTTARMTAIRHPLYSLIGVFVILMTGELLHRERRVGLGDIFDALPASPVSRVVPKLIALFGGAAALMGVLGAASLAVQVASLLPITSIDWRLYAQDLIVDGWWPLCQLILLAGAVSVIINQRVTSHLVSIGLFVCLWSLNTIQDTWLLFSFLPGQKAYSELTGYGDWESVRYWASLVWWGVAGVLLLITLLAWSRGVSLSLHQRLYEINRRFNRVYTLGLSGCVLIMLVGLVRLNATLPTPLANVPSGAVAAIAYSGMKSQSTLYRSISGKRIPVSVIYGHPYQVDRFIKVAVAALRLGESLFGPYPFNTLQLREVPRTKATPNQPQPGRIDLSEDEGWTADAGATDQIDYIDYLITRQVLIQWLVHNLVAAGHQPTEEFMLLNVADYLALQVVKERYGSTRLQYRLSQRAKRYLTELSRHDGVEPTLLTASPPPLILRDRAALVLTSLGQVMGDTALQQVIVNFYKQAIQAPQPRTTVTDFVRLLAQQLPSSLQYLTSYFGHRYWFDFRLGQVFRLPEEVVVEVIASKTEDDGLGHKTSVLINDLVPLVLFDQEGHELYRQLVQPAPFQSKFRLPLLPGATHVVVDPLTTWPGSDLNKNWKRF